VALPSPARRLKGGVGWIGLALLPGPPGRKPEGHRRALAREARSQGKQSSELQGQSPARAARMLLTARVAATYDREREPPPYLINTGSPRAVLALRGPGLHNCAIPKNCW
jgi:hypothetical protein